MSIIIVGGSGMLTNTLRWIVDNFNEDIYLLSRNKDRYDSLLLEQSNVHFKHYDYLHPETFDFTVDDVTLMISWVHSEGYANHLHFLKEHVSWTKNKHRYIHIVGTQKHDDKDLLTYLSASNITVSTVTLGYKEALGGQKRWLYTSEIAHGTILAISSGDDVQVGIVADKN